MIYAITGNNTEDVVQEFHRRLPTNYNLLHLISGITHRRASIKEDTLYNYC